MFASVLPSFWHSGGQRADQGVSSRSKIFYMALVLLYAVVLRANALERSTEPALELSRYNKEEVHGCYKYNESLSLCFDIGPDFMKLSSKNGDILVFLQDVGEGLSLFQILDDRFIGFNSFLIALPTDAPTSLDELLVYWIHNYGANYTPTRGDQELFKVKYHGAMRKLGKTGDILLLELLSAALGHQEHQIKALQPFHATCRVLLNRLNIQLSPTFRAARTPDKNRGLKKRCIDLSSNPHDDQCLGMCGPGCNCWSWVCGDCCFNDGCHDHDRCCRSAGILSLRCLLLFFYDFSCNGYGGYPDCLE